MTELINNRSLIFLRIYFTEIERHHVQTGLTIVFTILYTTLFLAAYIQLWMIMILNQKLLSTQTIYFFLCCIFTGLRIVLFSFFYHDFDKADKLNWVWYWTLLCLPIIIQYSIVLLITVFYYRTYERVFANGELNNHKNIAYKVGAGLMVIMVLLNLMPVIYGMFYDLQNDQKMMIRSTLIILRVGLTDAIFFVTILVFVIVYCQFPRLPVGRLTHDVKNVTKAKSIIVGCCCLIVVIIKLIYDTFQSFLLFDRKYNVPLVLQQANFATLHHDMLAFILFGSLLFFWEGLPLIIVMIIFRVRLPYWFFKNRNQPINRSIYNQWENTTSVSASYNTNVVVSSPTKSKFIAVPTRYVPYYGATSTEGTSTSGQLYSPVYRGFQPTNTILRSSSYVATVPRSNFIGVNIHRNASVPFPRKPVQTTKSTVPSSTSNNNNAINNSDSNTTNVITSNRAALQRYKQQFGK